MRQHADPKAARRAALRTDTRIAGFIDLESMGTATANERE
jgi:hypothetical protein